VSQQEREPGVAGGRSSPHVKANLISEKGNGDSQSECHVPEMAVVGSKDTCTQGSTDSANRNAEIKVDGDPGGVTVGHDYTTTHTWADPSLRNGGTMSRPGGDEPRIGPGSSSNNIQTQERFYRVNPYAQSWREDGGLGMEAICSIGVGTRESSHSINTDGESQLDGYGKGMAVSRTGEDNSATNRGAMSQPEGGGMRMAPGNHNDTQAQTSSNPENRNAGSYLEGAGPRIAGSSRAADTGERAHFQTDPILVNRDPKGRPGGSGRGFEGSSNPAIGRWENPDSAGGLVRWTEVEITKYNEGGPEIDLEQIRRARAPHRRVMALCRRLIRVKRNL